ncbi:MAG: hypothetical protein LBC82_03540 [Oscillospiraceae bacterium]|jgi:tetratricopeptide (TPR) repeat protein|nr:hypothetical protein [Oscillospiraceae bacterium]
MKDTLEQGKLFYSQEKYKKAIKCFAKVIKHESDTWRVFQAYDLSGESYCNLAMYDKAIEYCSQAIEIFLELKKTPNYNEYKSIINKEVANTYATRGHIYSCTAGKTEVDKQIKSKENYEEAVTLDPSRKKYQENLDITNKNIEIAKRNLEIQKSGEQPRCDLCGIQMKKETLPGLSSWWWACPKHGVED